MAKRSHEIIEDYNLTTYIMYHSRENSSEITYSDVLEKINNIKKLSDLTDKQNIEIQNVKDYKMTPLYAAIFNNKIEFIENILNRIKELRGNPCTEIGKLSNDIKEEKPIYPIKDISKTINDIFLAYCASTQGGSKKLKSSKKRKLSRKRKFLRK